MADLTQLLQQLSAQHGGNQKLEQIRRALETPEGQQSVRRLTEQNADLMERAAQAAQSGNLSEAAQYASQLMQSPDGAALAQKLKELF